MLARILTYLGLSISFLTMIAAPAYPQSLTSGDVTGIVTDQSGAVLPNASVTLKNNQTGATATRTTNAQGSYRFPLLNPGSYTVSATAQGFQTTSQAVEVSVGQASTVNVQLGLAAAAPQTVEVTGEGGVVQVDNGNVSTTFSSTQIANVPNPGNDLTYYVQTTPGAAMNTQVGYGNSATFGISATSNLFTVNGMNENDPFLNLNNSGATNLLLGSNDIETATVVNNGYTGEYGELAGANVNFVTRAGTNNFHGNAQYFWNGRTMNANDWFNNQSVPPTPRSFVNANQWAASLGGPIKKDSTFFFVNTEGLRLLIPTARAVNVPSPQFEAATLSNIPSAEIPFYRNLFNIYNGAPGYRNAAPVQGLSCGTATPADFGITGPCALQFRSNTNNLTTEWLLTGRLDQNIGDHDRVFLHFRTDHGLQATYTDPFTNVLNAQSVQPQYEGQIQHNHSFANGVNQLNIAGSWYSAIFQPPNLTSAIALLPFQLNFSDGVFRTPGGGNYSTWPQGRNVTQYQIGDDLSLQKGPHALKFGVHFRRNDITDFTPGGFNATIPTATFASLNSFFAGKADTFQQAFTVRNTQPVALYTLGLFASDEWAVTKNLKITPALRIEHFSNPVCQTNCFSRLTDDFFTVSHNPLQPYNQAIRSGLHQALPNYQGIGWGPRLGFAWQPLGNQRTVIRGGAGIFYDVFPATVASSFNSNSPLKNTFVIPSAGVAPGLPGSGTTLATAANTAFLQGFSSGLNVAQIAALQGTSFSPPAFSTAAHRMRYPTYDEWNLEVQQAIGAKTSFSINYVGNHGSNLALLNPAVNAFCNGPNTPLPFQPTLAGTQGGDCQTALGVSGFVGLPLTPTDPRFSSVSLAQNPGVSNYHGVTASVTRRFSAFQVQANYTYSHALDDISNGGFLPFNFNTNTAILGPQDPFNLRRFNYGNADYDVRHNFSANYVYTTPMVHGLLGVLSSWTI
ncbi:MAG: carboxypeptidase regulatory-like domain-containing protein, partial [Acidobacteria bacterium]|nr:carboxypeptidase regulatory-like domain-containing protein [Acidobacteriota bacterium]